MPSRDGLLDHLNDAHLFRIHSIERFMEAERGLAEAVIRGMSFSTLARLHGEFHRLDSQDTPGVESVSADTSAEGQVI